MVYEDINLKLHRLLCGGNMAWREVFQVATSGIWSVLLPIERGRALPYSHPRRVDVASVVVVLARGAGCLGSAVVFQYDAALPGLVQLCCMIPYQIWALGD